VRADGPSATCHELTRRILSRDAQQLADCESGGSLDPRCAPAVICQGRTAMAADDAPRADVLTHGAGPPPDGRVPRHTAAVRRGQAGPGRRPRGCAAGGRCAGPRSGCGAGRPLPRAAGPPRRRGARGAPGRALQSDRVGDVPVHRRTELATRGDPRTGRPVLRRGCRLAEGHPTRRRALRARASRRLLRVLGPIPRPRRRVPGVYGGPGTA
jgi:hypothetical protein